MAKDTDKPEQAMVAISKEDLKELLGAIQQQSKEDALAMVKAFVEETKKPSEHDVAKRKREKAQWRLISEQDRGYEAAKQAACRHRHPRENKSLFWRLANQFVPGGWTLVCCRCYKQLRNYEKGELVYNKEFQEWFHEPTIADV